MQTAPHRRHMMTVREIEAWIARERALQGEHVIKHCDREYWAPGNKWKHLRGIHETQQTIDVLTKVLRGHEGKG